MADKSSPAQGGRQIVPNGPRLPATLLQALEDGRLMFFCGAGVSMGPDPWGLPGFKELTLRAFRDGNQAIVDGLPVDLAARDAMSREQYDKALEILETREGHRGDMRSAIAAVLTSQAGLDDPNWRNPCLARHRALLDLAAIRNLSSGTTDGYRLVTTNFDNRFELAGLDLRLNEDGPKVRQPAHAEITPLVHLHGRIGPHDPQHSALVLTSRDFGNAYLRHGWAARFVIEMFREFTVLFIGYSINDPVMRYLMDALATESGDGKQFRPVFAFASFSGNAACDREAALWQAKRVHPILYDADHDPTRRHGLLLDTLAEWAAQHRQGRRGRLKLATDATARPFQRGVDDCAPLDLLASVVWALDTPDGEIARRFAIADPPPHISWLGPILGRLERRSALNSDSLRGTIARPSQPPESRVAIWLAKWAGRHLDDKVLTDWTCLQSEGIFPELRRSIEARLAGHGEPLAEPYRRFWQLTLLAAHHAAERGRWGRPSFQPSGSSSRAGTMLAELRPRVVGPRPSDRLFFYERAGEPQPSPQSVRDLGRFEIEHDGAYAVAAPQFAHEANQSDDLLASADALTTLLSEWCELGAATGISVGRGDTYGDRDYLIRLPHPDRHEHALDLLVDLTMASLRGLSERRPDDARAVLARWRLVGDRPGYLIFTRLWLWAAADLDVIDPTDAFAFLLIRPDVLWGRAYEPETLRLLRLRLIHARQRVRAQVVAAMMKRPPDAAIPEYLNGRDRRAWVDGRRGQRLAKIAWGGVPLSGRAAALGNEIVERWRRDRAFDDALEVDRPHDREELDRMFPEPDASALVGLTADEIATKVSACERERDMASLAEKIAAREPHRVPELLGAFRRAGVSQHLPYSALFWSLRSKGQDAEKALSAIGPIADAIDNDPAMADLCVAGAAGWIKVVAEGGRLPSPYAAPFWRLWDQLARLSLPFEPDGDDDPLSQALNSAGGQLAEALLVSEGGVGGPPGRGLTSLHRGRFAAIAAAAGAIGVNARVMLYSQLQWLDVVDPSWTRETLLPRFRWDGTSLQETVRAWRTFSIRPNATPELLELMAPMFVKAMSRQHQLGENARRRLCTMFGDLIVEQPGLFSKDHTVAVLAEIGADGCRAVLRGLVRKLRAAGPNAAALWRERIGPWIDTHWPTDEALRTACVADEGIDLVFESREAFPAAASVVSQKFDVSTFSDPSPGWMFTLYHAINKTEYDYLARHTEEVGRFLERCLSGKTANHAEALMTKVLNRVRTLLPSPLPQVWQSLADRYVSDS
jgi:hypothetical protein